MTQELMYVADQLFTIFTARITNVEHTHTWCMLRLQDVPSKLQWVTNLSLTIQVYSSFI